MIKRLLAPFLLLAGFVHAQVQLGGHVYVPSSSDSALGKASVVFTADANCNTGTATNCTITGGASGPYSGTLVVTATATLTATRNMVLVGGPGSVYLIENSTSQSIVAIGATGTGVTIPAGVSMEAFNDGTNYVAPAVGVPVTGGLGNVPTAPNVSVTGNCIKAANTTFGLADSGGPCGGSQQVTGKTITITTAMELSNAETICASVTCQFIHVQGAALTNTVAPYTVPTTAKLKFDCGSTITAGVTTALNLLGVQFDADLCPVFSGAAGSFLNLTPAKMEWLGSITDPATSTLLAAILPQTGGGQVITQPSYYAWNFNGVSAVPWTVPAIEFVGAKIPNVDNPAAPTKLQNGTVFGPYGGYYCANDLNVHDMGFDNGSARTSTAPSAVLDFNCYNTATVTSPPDLPVAGTQTAASTPSLARQYCYTIVANNSNAPSPSSSPGVTNESPELCVTITAAGNNLPLTWTAQTNATSYTVWRGVTPGGESVSYPSATNSFTDTFGAGTTGIPQQYNTTGAYGKRLKTANLRVLANTSTTGSAHNFKVEGYTGWESQNIYTHLGFDSHVIKAIDYDETGVFMEGYGGPGLFIVSNTYAPNGNGKIKLVRAKSLVAGDTPSCVNFLGETAPIMDVNVDGTDCVGTQHALTATGNQSTAFMKNISVINMDGIKLVSTMFDVQSFITGLDFLGGHCTRCGLIMSVPTVTTYPTLGRFSINNLVVDPSTAGNTCVVPGAGVTFYNSPTAYNGQCPGSPLPTPLTQVVLASEGTTLPLTGGATFGSTFTVAGGGAKAAKLELFVSTPEACPTTKPVIRLYNMTQLAAGITPNSSQQIIMADAATSTTTATGTAGTYTFTIGTGGGAWLVGNTVSAASGVGPQMLITAVTGGGTTITVNQKIPAFSGTSVTATQGNYFQGNLGESALGNPGDVFQLRQDAGATSCTTAPVLKAVMSYRPAL